MFKRMRNKGLARLAANWPALSAKLVASFNPVESTSVPWHPLEKPLKRSKLAMVTTAGLHHPRQRPFDMRDASGDPSFRIIQGDAIEAGYTITHDYYDHRDADRDLNVVFPITRLKEMHAAGYIGALSQQHFSFMGHIDGPHVQTLIHDSAAQVARMLREQQVDAVVLTPA